ncbi:hypothetical protein MPH_00324 [Macrophomina phaseolina MS6]|uniref:DUF202 domain-containing protein n=1 Tax=Macrophomina phaseolina (strain MS6) TaxID=1126212 RepID=K2SIP4_MACPH|nr:hypothetical protein MPH_00324 [Macrophomina phaseolina MS6]
MMSNSPGDEPIRRRPSSTDPPLQHQHAQSPVGSRSTPSPPGRCSPPAGSRATTPTSPAEHAPARPADAAAPRDVVDGRDTKKAAAHGPRTAAHDAGAAREEGTAGDTVPEPGGRGDDAAEDDTALSTANDREATELTSISRRSVAASADGDAVSEVPTAADACSARERRKCQLARQRVGWTDRVARWWRRHVSVTVAAGGMRDHLALERTFLGYLRTSIALSMMGVITAQVMRLQHAPNPDPKFGYYALGKPLAAVFITSAILVVLLGAIRCWRQQDAMVRGKVHAGGWEILTIMIGSLVLMTILFALLLGVWIKKEREGED